MHFFTVKPMGIDVQELIFIFHYTVLGYIKVKIAIFCQLKFIGILGAKLEIGSIWQKDQCALSQIRFQQSVVIL